jgi:hypothetical protein
MPTGYLDTRLIAWSWAEAKLRDAANYWIATTCPDGRPHARPVWGVWLRDTLLFSNGSLLARNLVHDPRVTVHLESGDEVVIIEGTATRVEQSDRTRREEFGAAYAPKYHWDVPLDDDGLFAVHPRIAFGWRCDPTGLDGGGLMAATATRWRFDD